jgi:hypothetical protein
MNRRLHPIAMAAVLAAAGAAHADVDYVDLRTSGININDGRVVVNVVNGQHTQIANAQTSFHLEMKAGCKGLNQRLTDTFVALGNAGMNGDVVEAMPAGVPKTQVSHRGNDEISWTEATLNVPTASLGSSLDPVKICKTWVDQRLGQGAQLHQILAQDKTIVKPLTLSAVAACGKNGDSNHWRTRTLAHQLTVVCKAGAVGGLGNIQAQQPAPPKPPGSLTKNLAVVASSLKALTPQYVGQCPAKLPFQAEVQADAAGEVDYKITFPPNANTPQQTRTGKLVFNGAGTQKTPIFEFTANTGYPVGVARLDIEQAGQNKVHEDFKVQCVQAPVGGSVQFAPKPGDGGGPSDKVLAPSTPKPPMGIQAVPPQPPKPPLGIQATPVEPPPPAPARAIQAQ